MIAAAHARQSEEIAALAELFRSELGGCGFDWSEVLAVLHESISPIRVQPVNQGTGSKSLDYASVKEPPGLRVIAVGGNSLSRGLTLEGLAVSYFLRNSKAYDTLLQMGRWFGYRSGYDDLCRIWMSVEAERWYRHVTEATGELKRDFKRMKRQKATPAEFGLRVRTHPDTLLITARNKMASGVNVVGAVRNISLAGMGIETPTLPADRSRNERNLELVDRFLSELSRDLGEPAPSPVGQALVWQRVHAASIATFLENFAVHPFNHDFQGDAIAEYLNAAAAANDPSLSFWNVAVPTGGAGEPVVLPGCPELKLKAKSRRVVHRKSSPPRLLVSGKSSRVGSIGDARFGMPDGLVGQITREAMSVDPPPKQVPEDAYRAGAQSPLLIVYLLQGFEREGRRGTAGFKETAWQNGLVLPALGLHFPGRKDGAQQYVVYRLNKIAQAELEFDGDDLEDDDDVD